MLSNFSPKLKLAIVLILSLVIVAIGYGVFTAISRQSKVEVTINAIPEDASLTLDGKQIRPGVTYLKEGSYTIKGSKEGFTDFTAQVYVDKDHKLMSVPLVPASKEAKEWQQKNMNKYTLLERAAGRAAAKEGETFREKNPITIVLPYKNLIYKIGYRADPADASGNSIILEIDAPEGYRNAAVQQIRNLGYDPTNFKINFRDYKNPFSS